MLGVSLDGTATSREKLADRQRAHKLVATALYGVLADHPSNEYSEEGLFDANEALESLKRLTTREYKDIHGKGF